MNPVNKILGNSQKGASIRLQNQWKKFSPIKKEQMRKTHKDTDRDGTPDKWDCQPRNPFKQDTNLETYNYPKGKDISYNEYKEEILNILQRKYGYNRSQAEYVLQEYVSFPIFMQQVKEAQKLLR